MSTIYLGPRGPGVFLDTQDGIPGTQVGTNGTEKDPSLDLADAVTIANEAGYHRLYVFRGTGSPVILDRNFKDWEFMSLGIGGIDLGDRIVENCRFFDLYLQGKRNQETYSTFYHRCMVIAMKQAAGQFYDCSFSGLNTLATGGYTQVYKDCRSKDPTTVPTFDFGLDLGYGTQVEVDFAGWHGGIKFAKMGASDQIARIDSQGADVTVESTCTDGLVRFFGRGPVINQGSGTRLEVYPSVSLG